MGHELDNSYATEEALAAKIRLLEAELLSLKQGLAAKRSSAELSSYPVDSTLTIIDDAWVTSILKFLVSHPSPNNLAQALERVGKALGVYAIGLWRWEEEGQQPRLAYYWAAPGLDSLQTEAFQQGECTEDLQEELRQNLPVCTLLTHGFVEVGEAPDHGLRIPYVEYHPAQQQKLRGFMQLHAKADRNWQGHEINALMNLLGWLFCFMEQQEQWQLLLDRDRRYQYAMEATNDGLWDWNLNTDKIYFSNSYLRMLGYGYEELPGNLKTLKDYFIHPEDLANLLQEYQVAVENQRESLQLQYRMLHRNGTTIWVQSKAKFFEPDTHGRATRCVGINTDITRFIKAQDELLHAKSQADMASKTKSEFLARISHEIRTPMNAIIGVGYLLEDTPLDDQQHSYLASINSAADSLLQIINQLLDFSKIETGRVILEHAHFDLEQVFEKVTRLFEISALHRSVNIVYDIAPDVPRFLRGDASRLSQILNHLINNSFQYSRTDQVVVRVKRKTPDPQLLVIEFSVEDSGLGMTAEKLTHVRESLLHQGQEAGGNTYGLGICNHLVHLMQGEMQIDSQPNRGCKVTFTACFEPSRLGEKTLVNQPRELGNIRTLIVDDNTIARTIIASTARSLSLQVEEADNPLEAMDKIRQADNSGQPYHVVLLDYRMPTINGLQLTGMIKKDRSLRTKPQVFLISAYHRDEISSTDPNAILVDEFLSKPVSESRLFEAISQAVNREQRLQEISPLIAGPEDSYALLRHKRVLIVEDNLVNQQVICGILKKKQVVTQVAGNGVEAVDAVAKAPQPFDAILMDLEMPEMDGLDATRNIRAQWPAEVLPIIAVTAQAMRGDRERCLDAGMNGYLSKPVNPELLYTTLLDMLRKKKIQHESSGE